MQNRLLESLERFRGMGTGLHFRKGFPTISANFYHRTNCTKQKGPNLLYKGLLKDHEGILETEGDMLKSLLEVRLLRAPCSALGMSCPPNLGGLSRPTECSLRLKFSSGGYPALSSTPFALIKKLWTAAAHFLPSVIAQTTKDCPRRMSPQAKTFFTLVACASSDSPN